MTKIEKISDYLLSIGYIKVNYKITLSDNSIWFVWNHGLSGNLSVALRPKVEDTKIPMFIKEGLNFECIKSSKDPVIYSKYKVIFLISNPNFPDDGIPVSTLESELNMSDTMDINISKMELLLSNDASMKKMIRNNKLESLLI